MKKLLCFIILILIFSAAVSCSMLQPADSETSDIYKPSPAPSADPEQEAYIDSLISDMTLEEQVSQLFMISLGNKTSYEYCKPNDKVNEILSKYKPGGFILFKGNITTVSETKELTDHIKSSSKICPFIGIDEEGGIVSRLYSAGLPGYVQQPSAGSIGSANDTTYAYNTAKTIGSTLKSIGVNLDFAPVADILTNPDNKVIGERSFGSDPDLVSKMVSAFSTGLHSEGIMTSPKHFPGHGGTAGDSHDGTVSIDYDKEHLYSIEFKPFIKAIQENTEFILMGHIKVPNADTSGLPASLSHYFVTDVLRNELDFKGIIITDAMDMGAVAEEYTSAEASIMAIEAGIDMILMPEDFDESLQSIIKAVDDGVISKNRIHESLKRILKTKINAGLINIEN